MKIAQISPLYESVPPTNYGGTERVVSYLTEELIRQGHEVTLFASGDSVTSAELVACSPRALRLDDGCVDQLAHIVLQLEKVIARVPDFDVIHFHTDYFHFPLSRREQFQHITTLHGRLDLPDLVPLYREFSEMPLISISDSQRRPLPWVNWVATVYHGLPEDLFTLNRNAGKYLAFLGRISPEKRVDRAIEIAQRVGMPLKIAAKIDKADAEYFHSEIERLFEEPLVEYIGEISEQEKNAFLGNAYALLFPIDWPEPFGLVMIESMACGTPIVAFRRGSVPEVMEDGRNGFVVENVDEAVKAVEAVGALSRAGCREVFERRFSASRMASDYLAVYEKCISAEPDDVAII